MVNCPTSLRQIFLFDADGLHGIDASLKHLHVIHVLAAISRAFWWILMEYTVLGTNIYIYICVCVCSGCIYIYVYICM